LAASVYQALVSDAPLDDDVALLAIEAVPIGASMQMTLEASPRVLAGLRATIRRWLMPMGVPDSDMFDIALATSEAASNAIEHAYGAREATFAVRCEHRDGEVTVAVEDAGRWRTSTPYGRGRGLAIMRALMDSVEIDRREEGTAVTLSKRIESTD
jgi:anti-sigma regulatory factor (Ser/Thr protein kinase)